MSPRKKKPAPPIRTPRQRMVLAAVSLLAERGLAGTSFAGVLERSGAPRGSIYHHFPDGKDALAKEAIAVVGSHVLSVLKPDPAISPRDVVRRFVDAWRQVLVSSQFRAGCAIAAVVNERLEHPELGARAASVLIAFESTLADALHASGLARGKADKAAALVLAACEGALILCRARVEIAPLDTVGLALEAFVSD